MKIVALMLTLSLGGCWVERQAVIGYYTKSDVDAITAETQCKAIARNLVQIERCKTAR